MVTVTGHCPILLFLKLLKVARMTRTRWTLVIGLVVCLLAGISIQQAGIAPNIAFDVLGSGTVPMFVAVILLVLVALMFIEEFVFGGPRIEFYEEGEIVEPSSDQVEPRWNANFRTFLILVVFIAYLFALDFLSVPFWAATFIATYISSRILEGGLGRGRITSLVVAAVIAGGIDIIFTNFLLIDLP